MNTPKSIKRPKKLGKNFPLFPHPNGSWAKKINYKVHYFGSWKNGVSAEDAKKAYLDFEEVRRAIAEGRAVPAKVVPEHVFTVAQAVNEFLHAKQQKVDSGELSQRTLFDYQSTGVKMVSHFGRDTPLESLRPTDFNAFRLALSKGRGPVALGNEIQKTKVILKFAFTADLIDKPIKVGDEFVKPSRKDMRRARNERGRRDYSNSDILHMLEHATPAMKAMILLGINAGLGNNDIALLPKSAIKHGWLIYPRHKTEVARRVPLWQETTDAIKIALTERPAPKDKHDAGLVFLTRTGRRWIHQGSRQNDQGETEPTGVWIDSVAMEFRKLLVKAGIKRPGVGFYGLRRTLETVGGESKDQIAVDFLMGHSAESGDMSSVYREGISDERLLNVVNHVHAWLYSGDKEPLSKPAADDDTLPKKKTAKSSANTSGISGRLGRKPRKKPAPPPS